MTYSTARAATSPELTNLRAGTQWSRLYLAVFKPSEVYSARLSAVPSSTDRVTQVSFTSGSGTLANVLPDMTLYAGSSAGAYDIGIARIRKAPIAGVFYIGEESEIAWNTVVSGGIYLTVVNEVDLWAKHIVTVDDETFYMDTDIAYTDQNSVFSPIPIMGSHRVLRLTGANVSTIYDFSNSYCIGSTISGYSVSCSTATITNGTTATPTLQFTTAGWHMVVLTVTAANGKTSTGIRYVYVYSSASPPTRVFQLESCYGDFETGGWTFTAVMQNQIGLTDVPDRAMCILFAEDFYDNTLTSMGQMAGSENIICVGKIAEETIDINAEQSEVTLTVHGMQYWFTKTYAFPTGVILTTSTPENWVEMQSPTVDKVLFRLFHWGSTATKIMDVYLTNDTRLATELISPASNLWAQIQEIAFATIQARSGVDRFGRLFVEVEAQVVPFASRTWATVMTITKKDWHDNVHVQRIVVSDTGMVNSSGVSITSDGNGNAVFSLAPGHVFKRYGAPEVVDRLLLSNQLSSNQLSSLLLNWRSNPFPNTEMKLSANNRMIDCFPRMRLIWSISAGDSPRGFSFTDYFIPRRVEFGWDNETGFLETAISMEREVVEGLYTNGDIPGSGDYDPGDPPDPPDFPDFPDFPPLFPIDTVPTTDSPTVLVFHDEDLGVFYTEDFDQSIPTYLTMNGGLTEAQYQQMNVMCVTPSGALYGGKANNGFNNCYLAYSPGVGQPWTIIEDKDTIFAKLGGISNNETFLTDVACNPITGQVAYVIGSWSGTLGVYTCKIYIGTGTSFSAGASIPNVGGGTNNASIGSLSYGGGKWLLTTSSGSGTDKQWFRISGDGSSYEATQDIGDAYTAHHIRAGTTAKVWFFPTFDNDLYYSDNNGTGAAIINGDIYLLSTFRHYSIAVDPTGTFMMAPWTNATVQGKSSDGGYSWVSAGPIPVGYRAFAYAGPEGTTSHRFVAAGATIYYTDDFGVTWYNKTGGMTTVNPFPSLNIVLVVG